MELMLMSSEIAQVEMNKVEGSKGDQSDICVRRDIAF